MARRANNRPQVPFAHKLVLNQWLLSLFNVERFEDLAEHLRNEALEGLDENNIHHFHHALTAQLFNLTQLPTEPLLEYDQNIVTHTQRLNERRITRGEEPIVWKYFQYLALLFSEIYLDRYFRDPKALLVELNGQVTAYNTNKPEADRIAAFDEADEAWPQLNKLAFWMATGSGKTLLMHANILQYQHVLTLHGRRRELNRILLLTPNEGLSQQHLREFEAAGIQAELFNKDGGGLLNGQVVEILEVTRLRDEMGDKTISIDAFEGNNLVLVDEGHRGTSGGEEGAWMRYRNALCEKGFSFEYSATFGQAVKGSPALDQLYAKNTLCDYSYRYFYRDGFGKDYQILNLDHGTQENHLELYLVACLLSFFPAAAVLPRARRHLPAIQHRESSVDLRRRASRQRSGLAGRFGHRADLAVPGALCGRPRRQHPAHRPGSQAGPRNRDGPEPVCRALRVSQYLRTLGGADLRRDTCDAFQRPRWRPALCREPEGRDRGSGPAAGLRERALRRHQRGRRRQAGETVRGARHCHG